jgi:uncharacterized phage-associated protein
MIRNTTMFETFGGASIPGNLRSHLVRHKFNYLHLVEKSLAVSNYFIKLSQDTGKELTPLKLIKLCYISHGWHLGLFDESLIDEVVYAWKFGPVIESVYHTFKGYRDSQIEELYREGLSYPMPNSDNRKFLNKIWDVYSVYNGVQLSTMTHQSGTPWDTIWNKRGGKSKPCAIIPNDLIRDFYQQKKLIPANELTPR